MISGALRNRVGAALVVLAVALFVVPALFPVQPLLTHDTRRTTNALPEELEAEGVEIIDYGDLSQRGQELYVRTLEHDGEYRVAEGEGASEFAYPNASQIRAWYDEQSGGSRPGIVVIERPVDGHLPESDERFFRERDENADANRTERRRQVLRYDMMETGKGQPPLGSPPQLLRLGAAVLAVVCLGTGGYLLSSKG